MIGALPLDAGSLNCPHPLGKCSILRRPVKGARNWRRVCDPPEYSCIGPLIRQARERARNNAKHKINPRASVGIRDGLIGVDKRNTSKKRRSNRTRLAGFGSVRSKGSGMARRPSSRFLPHLRVPTPGFLPLRVSRLLLGIPSVPRTKEGRSPDPPRFPFFPNRAAPFSQPTRSPDSWDPPSVPFFSDGGSLVSRSTLIAENWDKRRKAKRTKREQGGGGGGV